MQEPANQRGPSGPDWDLTGFFADGDGHAGEAYREFRVSLAEDGRRLRERARSLAAITRANVRDWAALIVDLEAAWARGQHLSVYLSCCSATDSKDEVLRTESASAEAERARLEQVFVLLRDAMRSVDDDTFATLLADERSKDAEHFLTRLRRRARFAMGAELEELVTELDVDGVGAWSRLYSTVSGALAFDLELPNGSKRREPVAMTRTLMEDADPAVRSAAFRGANAAWESVGDVAVACLNAISGTRLSLYRRRGVEHFLDPALFDAAISRPTLEALLSAVEERAEVPRAFLREKAAAFGLERLRFHDLSAPLPIGETARIPWTLATERVCAAFARSYPALASFAEAAVARRWIDHTPRPGRRPGGFCASSHLLGESRIYLTYDGSDGDLATLAHELGHAWHAWLLRDQRSWGRRYPMTLAETASTFAENLVVDAVLGEEESGLRRAHVLNGHLQHAATYLLDILARFRFEEALYTERAKGELPKSRLIELMASSQRAAYGDALAADGLDPWFWASKRHFYLSTSSFYNFPYTFGYLLSLGLATRLAQEGPKFLPRYEEFLARSGRDAAEGVARSVLGVDLACPDFWRATIDPIQERLDLFAESMRTMPVA